MNTTGSGLLLLYCLDILFLVIEFTYRQRGKGGDMDEDPFDKTVMINRSAAVNIISLRAKGGLSEIYLAFDSAGEQVILRRLRPEHRFSLGLRRRFVHGIKVRRKLGRHQNVVQYRAQQGGLQPAEVIEYVPGESLKTLILDKHRLVREQPFGILEQIAEALAHMHRKGFLHLDVKPENVLIEYVGEGCRAKLTDFDFSQPVSVKKVSRRFGGSVLYEPPEFLASKEISIGTDVFAFGVMTYYLFTGHMPFVQSAHELMRAPNQEVQFAAGNENRATPPVQMFIRRCLAYRPEYRYDSDKSLLMGLRKAAREHAVYLGKQSTDENWS